MCSTSIRARAARATLAARLGRHSGCSRLHAESCAFRDHAQELADRGALLAGLSAQPLDDQVEFAERNQIPYPVIADPERRLGAAMRLPTFDVEGMTLYKRITLVVEACAVAKVFYPVFPPDKNAEEVLAWLQERARDARHVRRRQGRRPSTATSSSSSSSDDARILRARRGADAAREYPLADVTLRAPIVPKKFFHTAGNFREHEEESKRVDWSHEIAPWIVFFQNVDAIVGPDQPIVYPEHLTQELDYELELAVVVKKPGKWFSPEEAADYIGGYVIFNDITARDIQRREMRSGVFSFCKAIDTFCPLGPWIVTPDEIPDPHDLRMELRVNGEPRQTSHSGNMSVTIPEILSHYSALGYSAGDVVSTGTVSGVAGFSEDAASLYLKPGDVIEAEIERIGVLRNPVVSWQDAHGTPAPARVQW